MRKMRPSKLSRKQFVELCNKSVSVHEVAALMKITTNAVYVRANRYRKSGEKIKYFKSAVNILNHVKDWDNLKGNLKQI